VNVVETIQAVRSAGGSVTVSAGTLIVDAPPDLPVAVWDALAMHKAVLVDLLTPRVPYVEAARLDERDAIQAEAAGEPVAFDLPRPAARCRLVRDAQARDHRHGFVTIPAGIEGWVVGLDEIGDRFERIHLGWHIDCDRGAGREPVLVSIDGRARVLDSSHLAIEKEVCQ
jgi:hypothetical protein